VICLPTQYLSCCGDNIPYSIVPNMNLMKDNDQSNQEQ
jgi:hypothetical protein